MLCLIRVNYVFFTIAYSNIIFLCFLVSHIFGGRWRIVNNGSLSQGVRSYGMGQLQRSMLPSKFYVTPLRNTWVPPPALNRAADSFGVVTA